MNTHFRSHCIIALLALVFIPLGAVEVYAEPVATSALSPPSNPLGDRAITNNGLSQRVVLYEEEPGNPEGTSAVGSVTWSTEMLSPGTGKDAEPAVRADIDIPERKVEVSWRLRRGADLGSSTNHTIEFLFKLPPNFAGGGIFGVPGMWMKPAERLRGSALAGLAAKLSPGYFLIGLSAARADNERNLQLLKDRPWIDIPIVYTNNRRALLAIEKGTPGAQVFQQVFAAWKE
jgi:hypothetical protein